jgi:hypothetical protein
MKSSAIAAYIFAAFCAILVLTTRGVSQDSVSKNGIPKWEYMVVDPDDKGGDGERRARLQAQLTPLGREGWEVVEAPYLKGVRYHVIILKRLIP